jgi:hypothetical protein
VNEFSPYALDWVLVPSCQEFRCLHVAVTWEPGIPTLHTYICCEEQNRCMTYSISAEVRVGNGKLGQVGL